MFHFETNPRKNTHTHLHPHDSQRQRFPAESRKRRYNGHVTDEKTKTKHTERKKKRKEKKEKKNREREPDPKRKNLPGNAPIRVHALTARQTRSGRKDTHDRNIPKCIGPRPEDVRRRPRARSRKCAHTRAHTRTLLRRSRPRPRRHLHPVRGTLTHKSSTQLHAQERLTNHERDNCCVRSFPPRPSATRSRTRTALCFHEQRLTV